MLIINSISELQKFATNARINRKKISLVPTMGFLHEGHLSLIDRGGEVSDIVIVTIFVNPTQFGPNEDLATYPRNIDRDLKLCEERGTDVVFIPENSEMYSDSFTTWVNEEELSKHLCGASRAGHFRGVTTIVTKLFNASLPDIAIFGQKDAQQALIIKKMVVDLNFPIEIIIAPTVRESDGLAMSSRNKYLSEQERTDALSINKSLTKAVKDIKNGETEVSKIENCIKKEIASNNGNIDYVEIRDCNSLEKIDKISKSALIAVATFFGKTRLIDNVIVIL